MTLSIEILDAKIKGEKFDFSFNYKGNIEGCIKIFSLFNEPERQKIEWRLQQERVEKMESALNASNEVFKPRPTKKELPPLRPYQQDAINEAQNLHINPITFEVGQKYTVKEAANIFKMGLSTFYANQIKGITPKPDITEGSRKYFSKAIVEKYILKMKKPPKQKVEIDDNYEAYFEENADVENDLVNGLKKILGK